MSNASSAPSSNLLRDVQGLRAIAVLTVMANHAALPLSGGFVGVDMFFVISGFIITLMLLREYESTGRVAFWAFYVRRIKRLAPALAVTSIVTVVLAFLFLSPLGPQEATYQTALGATLGMANAVVAVASGDYFGPNAESNPLLHTWSLSVEEQFYLVLPALLFLLLWLGRRLRFGPNRLFAVMGLGGLAVASLWSVRMSVNFPFGYYGPFSRAWEFLAGCLVALILPLVRMLPRWLLALSGWLGLAGVGIACIVITAETLFPGKATLLPVCATVLMLVSSRRGENSLTKLLGSRPMVAIGDWSYSLYLWHWPMIVTARAMLPFSTVAPVIAGLLSVAPAYLTYVHVEQPCRRLKVVRATELGRLLARTAVPALGAALTAWASWAWVLVPAMTPGGALAPRVAQHEERDPRDVLHPCPDSALQRLSNGLCGTTKGGEPTAALIGDSHAEHLVLALAEQYPKLNFLVMTVRSPKPFGSPAGAQAVADYITDQSNLRFVIYSRALFRGQAGLSEHERAGMAAVALALDSAGRPLYILTDNPRWPTDMFGCVYRTAVALPGDTCQHERDYFAGDDQAIKEDLRTIEAQFPSVEVVDIFGALCDDEVCRRADADRALYSDADHVTQAGAQRIVREATRQSSRLAAALSQS